MTVIRPTAWRHRLLDDTALGIIEDYIGTYQLRYQGAYGVHLRSENKSKTTIDRYWLATHQLAEFLDGIGESTDVGRITRSHIEKFVAESLATAAASTVNGRYVALRQFFAFVAVELNPTPYTSPMAGMKPPAFEPPMIEIIPDRVLAGILAQVEGGRERKTFEQIRDAAIIRLFMDTGARNAELTGITMGDLLEGNIIRLWGKSKGKGPVERHVPYGDRTGQALRRYLRVRSQHPGAVASGGLWLGLRGPMTTSGVRQMIWKRSEKAGQRVHPHQFRHTFAHKWKQDERRKDGDLKYLTGWRTDTMLHRYGKSADEERAIDAYRHLGSPLGDL